MNSTPIEAVSKKIHHGGTETQRTRNRKKSSVFLCLCGEVLLENQDPAFEDKTDSNNYRKFAC
jgi:hypothetical protein